MIAAGKCLTVFDVTDGTMQLCSIEQALSFNGGAGSEEVPPPATAKTMTWMLPTDPKAAIA